MESYASNEPRIGIVKTAMSACARFAVFTYAEMRRTPRYEIRLAALYADNLMNSVAHCGGFYLRDKVEEKCKLRPACRKLPGLSREKTLITPRLSETSGAQQRKNTDYALLVGNFRGSTEKKHELRPACRNLPGLNREKTRITPRLSGTSGAQQRKNVNYRAFRNVGYKKCRDAHRGKMFRLLWTFVDLKLPSAMSHAIHKIVSIKRCQSYFISRRSPHLGISEDSESCASAHRCLHYAYARLIARVTFQLISRHSRFGRLPIPPDSSILKSNIKTIKGGW